MSTTPITHQPQATLTSLDLKQPPTLPIHEKRFQDFEDDEHHCQHHHSTGFEFEHNKCHNARMKQLLWPALIILLALGGLVVWSCVSWHGWSDWGVDDLVGRAITSSNSNGSGNSFVHKKLYLIVIFVGLLVVLILGIMLTACCCKGSFKNPLCCPCYLCACCGGLACLECISCGLCAELANV